MPYESILTEDRDRVRYVTLNRPDKLNAFTRAMLEEVLDSVRAAEQDPGVGSIVLRGAGRAFSSGMDLSSNPNEPKFTQLTLRQEINRINALQGRFDAIWDCTKPVVAQIHGYCLGVGTDLAFQADMVIASEDVQIGYPPTRVMGSPTTHMWTYLAGPQWAKRMLLTGESIDGKTAERAGMVLMAVPKERLAEEVHRLAASMAAVPYEVLAQNKSICNKAMELMGRHLLQQLARENDAMAHRSPASGEFFRISEERGLKAAFEWQQSALGKGL